MNKKESLFFEAFTVPPTCENVSPRTKKKGPPKGRIKRCKKIYFATSNLSMSSLLNNTKKCKRIKRVKKNYKNYNWGRNWEN